jgi:myosin heavy subunit
VQLIALKSGFTSTKKQLLMEQAASTSFKSAAAELRQRLVNIRSTGTQHAAVVAATVSKAQVEQAVALAEAQAATTKLQQTKGELQQTKQQLSAERAAKAELTNKSQELQQRLTNMRLTSAKRVVSAAAATAAADAAAAAARESAAAKDEALVVAVAAAATAAVEKERSAAAKAELQEAKQQLVQMQQYHQEQIEVVEERAKAAEKQAAEVVQAAEAAVAQQEGQLQQVRHTVMRASALGCAVAGFPQSVLLQAPTALFTQGHQFTEHLRLGVLALAWFLCTLYPRQSQ